MTRDFMQDPSHAGLFFLPPECQETVMPRAASLGLELMSADLGACADSHSALRELGDALHFPDWYGVNLDALHDCLTDPEWQDQAGQGQALFISGLPSLQNGDPDGYANLLDVFRSAADIRLATGTPLWIFIDVANPEIALFPEP